jgi:hypothetical protein
MLENMNSQIQVVVSYIPLPLKHNGETHSEHLIDEGPIIRIL